MPMTIACQTTMIGNEGIDSGSRLSRRNDNEGVDGGNEIAALAPLLAMTTGGLNDHGLGVLMTCYPSYTRGKLMQYSVPFSRFSSSVPLS